MQISIPEPMAAWVEEQTKRAGLTSPDEYVLSLLVRERDCAPEDGIDYGAPDHLKIQNGADLEAKLLAGLNSGPAVPVDEEFWKERKRTFEERLAGHRSSLA